MKRHCFLYAIALLLCMSACGSDIELPIPQEKLTLSLPTNTEATQELLPEQSAATIEFETMLLQYFFEGTAELTDTNLIALYKAVSSLDYHGGYWAMGYEGLDGYSADSMKRELVNTLLEVWNSGSDRAAENLKENISFNEHFSKKFTEALTKILYTYSYHAFAEEYGIRSNRTYTDAQDIRFAQDDDEFGYIYAGAEHYLGYDGCEFYEYDFDGDGADELGVPIHSGAGGMFQADGFGIFKKNEDGLYAGFAWGPDCTLRDAMRIIRYDGKIYFLVNPFSDTGNTPHDIRAYTIDRIGNGHEISLTCKDYRLQCVATYTDSAYKTGYETIFYELDTQGQSAVSAFKNHEVYSPEEEKNFSYKPGADWWSEHSYMGSDSQKAIQDVFFAADIDNDGASEVIHKGHLITQSKYYDDYNWFQIYKNREAFDNGTAVVQKPDMLGDAFYGLHSSGNLYDLLSVDNNIVQFWTNEYDGITYCAALQRNTLLYTLNVYMIKDDETRLVRKIIYFDEMQGADTTFL